MSDEQPRNVGVLNNFWRFYSKIPFLGKSIKSFKNAPRRLEIGRKSFIMVARIHRRIFSSIPPIFHSFWGFGHPFRSLCSGSSSLIYCRLGHERDISSDFFGFLKFQFNKFSIIKQDCQRHLCRRYVLFW